ncbi:glycerophosphodiester phosphodiesterase family protein [uncultured Cyclobacterium sp.]|uniref:glycerophosphodiester phosphodiesterase family protein n=1 Tax=uncultured Cyclobacterium sp. TaxID=453820 RepID=UPI0030EB5281|tara:strand:+ start:277945 stop:278772 length:828 start_codon:yes stop_codon:yes gene_type:complete
MHLFTKKILTPFLLFFLFIQLGQAQVDEIKEKFLNSYDLMVIAHRAANQNFPENSIIAIEEAIRMGVDIIELDIRVTADGVVILMHDQTVDRTTTGTGDVETLNYSYLQSLQLLHKNAPTREKIPTLEEALKVTKGRIMVDMDMKTDKVDEVLEVVKAMDVVDELLFFDSDWDVLEAFQESLPDAFIMPRTYKAREIKKAVKRFNPRAVHIDPSFYTPKTVALAKKYDVRLWINALGDIDRKMLANPDQKWAREWLDKGATMVQTDVPSFWTQLK